MSLKETKYECLTPLIITRCMYYIDAVQGNLISMQEYCATRGYIFVINSNIWSAPIPGGPPPGFELL